MTTLTMSHVAFALGTPCGLRSCLGGRGVADVLAFALALEVLQELSRHLAVFLFALARHMSLGFFLGLTVIHW